MPLIRFKSSDDIISAPIASNALPPDFYERMDKTLEDCLVLDDLHTMLGRSPIDLNAEHPTKRGTLLTWAAEYHREDIVKFLLEQGADPEISGGTLMTPREWAESTPAVKGRENRREETIKLLSLEELSSNLDVPRRQFHSSVLSLFPSGDRRASVDSIQADTEEATDLDGVDLTIGAGAEANLGGGEIPKAEENSSELYPIIKRVAADNELNFMSIDDKEAREFMSIPTSVLHKYFLQHGLRPPKWLKCSRNSDSPIIWANLEEWVNFALDLECKGLLFRRCSGLSGDIATVNRLVDITYLNLALCPRVSGEIKSIANLVHLTKLYLYETNVDGDIADIGGLVNLTELYLDDTHVTGDIKGVAGLVQLNDLRLNNTKVFGDIASIGTLTRLTELRLSGTDVSGDIKDIVGLKNLQVLFLSSTAVNMPTNCPKGNDCDYASADSCRRLFQWLERSEPHLHGCLGLIGNRNDCVVS